MRTDREGFWKGTRSRCVFATTLRSTPHSTKTVTTATHIKEIFSGLVGERRDNDTDKSLVGKGESD